MGAISWYGKSPAELFADVRKAWPSAVLQVNHPRARKLGGYFSYVGYDAASGSAEHPDWSRDFDAVEVFNASGWTANRDGTVADWFSFLDRGFLVTATGNSDSHYAHRHEVGYPRNCVMLSTDEPANLNLAEMAAAVKEQRVLVSGGPFVTARIGDQTMGDVVDASGGLVQLAVKVQAPTWMDIARLQVYAGGDVVHDVTLDASTVDPANPVVRFDDALPLTPAADTWVVVVVTGPGTLEPVNRGDRPFAVTNPIYLDTDGNTVYDPLHSF
jgi:hypothetical protein